MSPRCSGAALRILHVVLDLHEGGLERIVTELVRHGHEAGHDAQVLCVDRAGQLAAELAPGQVAVAAGQGRFSMLLPKRLASAIRGLDPHLVHVHSGVWLKAAYASRIARVPHVVFTDHGRPFPDRLEHRIPDMLGGYLTDAVVAVSAPLADYLATRLHVPKRKLAIIPNGIRLPAIAGAAERAAARRELGIAGDALVVGTVGRLDPVKAYDRLIDAFAAATNSEVSSNTPKVLLIVGNGPERERLERHAASLALGNSVRFLGWRQDTARLLGVVDLFVLSSDSEGTSLALLEAMAAEVATLATAVGGTPDVLDGGAGLLVRPRDTPALAVAIRRLLSSPGLRAEVARQGRLRAERRYSFSAMADAYRALYEGLAHPAGSSGSPGS